MSITPWTSNPTTRCLQASFFCRICFSHFTLLLPDVSLLLEVKLMSINKTNDRISDADKIVQENRENEQSSDHKWYNPNQVHTIKYLGTAQIYVFFFN
mgnify:CR=1 FL=1